MDKQPVMSGTVTPPDDLQPAIDALGPVGKALLDVRVAATGGTVTPDMLAVSADYGREHGEP